MLMFQRTRIHMRDLLVQILQFPSRADTDGGVCVVIALNAEKISLHVMERS